MPTQATVIFSTERYAFMRDAIAAESGFEIGNIERKAFPDGEHYRRILSDVAGRDVIRGRQNHASESRCCLRCRCSS